MIDHLILGHGSGIDDVIMFGLPLVVAVILMRRAEKKAKQRIESTAEVDGGDAPRT
jgi:hypothetical protein